MNVLWVKADYPLPLDSGSKKRTFNLLKKAGPDLTVTYIGFVPDQNYIAAPGLAGVVEHEHTIYRPRERKEGPAFYLRVLSNLGSPQPYFAKRNTSRQIQRLMRDQLRDHSFDLLVCDGVDMSINVDFALPIPKILLSHGIETTLWQQRYETSHGYLRRAYFNYETKRMAAFERQMCNRFDMVLTVSQLDKDRLESEFNVRVPIEVIETGVDCVYFSRGQDIATVPHKLVFTGSQDLLSNIDGLLWFAAEVYPAVKKEYPDVTLDIVGPDPASEIIALGKKDESIKVTGWVEDVRPYLAAAEAFIVPLRAPGGTRVKIYEAMCLKTPVVSTTYGAEGLSLLPNINLLIADTAKDFASSIIELFGNKEKRDSLVDNGWRMVNEKYDWTSMSERMVRVFHQLLDAVKKT